MIEKATGAKLGEIGIASAEDVSAAAATAREAQKDWARLPGPKRGDVLREFSRLLLAHADEIADQLVRETGSIRPKAQWEVQITAREFLEAAALGSQPQGVLTASLEAERQSIARRIPVGVVGIITPWNSPLILGARAIGPALAMGNAVLLKPDVQTPIVGGVIFARLLEEAGLPNGLFHVLPGAAETGAALVKEPLIDMISFTGSTRVGRQVGSVAGGQLKRVSLELGGNNPYIVLDDADIEAAASAGAWGAFFHQGQICLTAGRHLVHERVAEAYVEALVRKAKALVVGNPFDEKVQVGPIVNERQAANVERIVAETIAKGAKVADRRLPQRTLLRADGHHRRDARNGGLRRRDLRPGRADHDLPGRRGGDRAGQRDGVRPRGGRRLGRSRPRPAHRRRTSLRRRPHQRPDGRCTGSMARSAASASPATASVTAR